MTDLRVARFLADATSGRLSRRQMLETGLRLGVATPIITAAWEATPARATGNPASERVLPVPAAMQGQSTGNFTILRDGSSPDLDPHVAYDSLSSMLFFGLYELLVQYKGSATDEIAPMLAESWETSEDGKAVTFKIAPNTRFHDGSVCDAQAVKDSFTRFLALNTGPVMVFKRFVSTPEQMTVVDPTTITFNLDRPSPLFLAAMASSYGPWVINPKMVEAHKTADDPWARSWFQINASGTGPYQLIENSPTEQVVMATFADYHGGWERPHFDRIVVRIVAEVATRRQLLEAGDADAAAHNLTPDDVEAIAANPDIDVEIYDSTAVYWTIMNAPRLRSVEARQGFSYAFPYADVMDSAYRGLLARSGPLASGVRASDPNVFLYETDLAKAKELILAAGFKEGDTFDYVFQSGDEVERVIAQLFQAQIAKIGFTLDIAELERSALFDLIFGDSPAEERPMFIGGWSWWPDYNDPFNQLDPNFSPKDGAGISNAGWWVNDRFNELLALCQVYESEADLVTWMKEIQNILTEQDPPVIYYGQAKWYTVLRKDIKGFIPNPIYLSAFNFDGMYRASSG
ncbi:MAG: ABC transporter substrate-binding protein [Thermomicrobiales bacterium]